jgi:streptomycin 6-kinase
MTEKTPVEIPVEFQTTIKKMFGPQGAEWLGRLPGLVQKYLELWNLQIDPLFHVSLSFNFVLPVVDANGKALMLKLGPHPKGRRREGQMLKLYAGRAAARLLASDDDQGVLLIERLRPGRDLRSFLSRGELSDSAATEVAAKTIKTLLAHAESAPVFMELPSVSVWGLGFEKFMRENQRGTSFPTEKILKADRIYKNLVASQKSVVALHGDLHHANILQQESQGSADSWFAIDPKGVEGDPAFEVGAFLRNPMRELAQQPGLEKLLRERLGVLCSTLGFETDRVWGWAYAQAVLAAIWAVEDGEQAWAEWLLVAEALEKAEV